MTSLDFVKELVNAFNVSNYGSKVNTNFVVEGDNIVVKFNCDQGSAKRYLSQMARDLVREYYSNESVACHAFDLGSFPFHFDKKWLKYDKKTRMTKLTVPIDSGVIFNLKVHFAEEFKLDVKNQVIKAIDEKHHLGKKRIEEILNASIEQVEIDSFSGYIKCLLFNSPNLQTYFVGALQEQIKKHCYNYSGFYDIDDNKVYFKDVENIGFVRSVTEVSKKEVGYNFYLQHSDNLKVKAKHYKDAIGELIFSLTGISIYRYYYDEFVDKGRISSGDRFAFIPMIKEGNNLRYLTHMEADKINAKFSHDILTNIRGQAEATRSNEFGEVYAFSDRQIALLIPVIIENSVINKDGQIEIDPGLRFQALSPAQSPFNSPMHAGPSGIRTPPNQRKKDTDSGYDSNSPPKPKDSGAQSSSGGPRSLFEQPQTQKCPTRSPDGALDGPPRQWSEREEETGRMFQLVLGEIDPSQPTCGQSQLSLTCRPPSIPSPRAWDNSISSNLGVSEDSPKDTENICNEEHKEQKVIGKSDRKSSDECSEAKSQDSKSPKKHGGGWFCKERKKLLPLKRRSVERDTISSSRSDLVHNVTEKPPVSKSFFSFPTRIKAKSNPPSGVTSPTHEGASGGLKPLTSDERKELRQFLSPELQKKLDSNSFSPGKERLLYLTHTPEGKRELSRFLCESKESQLRRLAEAQLSSPDNSSSKRDSGFCSMGSPAVPHKESVSSEVKECRTVEHTRETWGKRI